jgi:hypothetical protein
MLNIKAEVQPLIGCPLLIIYIRRTPSYLEAVSSIRNLRIRRAVVTTDKLSMVLG